ncbi:glycoprotein 3-alpha-L-fucosyltransferase A-like [Mytilus trossulus]|uniref:glycoprotein 3-alpha-L-fucosyltransferase A-like n=1 Tax=Mytilus trossulus TaxID=6551 RepID=UPI00300668DC
MRFHLRKLVTYVVAALVLFVVINFYGNNTWMFESNEAPWGPSMTKHIPIKPKYSGKIVHEHVILGNKNHSKSKFANASKLGSEFGLKREEAFVLEDKEKNPFGKKVSYDGVEGRVWFSNDYYDDDRIVAQMRYKPPHIIEAEKKKEQVPLKTILLYHGFGGWALKKGQKTFQDQQCPVQQCTVTDDRRSAETADAVMFHHSPSKPWTKRPNNQIWILFLLESPYHTPGLSGFNNVFNWTASYRHDSIIVAPYEKMVPHDPNVITKKQDKNYAVGKTKKVAWFVSNCGARNGRRQYADELGKYIQVDIYGACGPYKCPRHNSEHCFNMLDKDYKFYLSFENSNCRDYITEKFFVNGLSHDVVPIVMGAHPNDYKRAAPPHSFIHIEDFDSPKDLAAYLHKLDKNDDLYNEYFQWKGTAGTVNTFYWCRICSMLHAAPSHKPMSYRDINRWWRGDGVCIGQSKWKDQPERKEIIDNYFGDV